MTEPPGLRPFGLLRDHGSLAESDVCKLDRPGVADLIEAGFLRAVPERGTAVWIGEREGEADRRLLRLLERLDLTLEVLPIAGARIALTNCRLRVGDGEERVSFVGKGFTLDDAIRRCLGEVAEFRSWLYDPQSDRTRIELDPPGPRLPGTAELLDCRDGSTPGDRAAFRAPGWSRVARLNGAGADPIWCRATLCFGRYASPARTAPEVGLDSNGCAAGASREDALAGALLELVERDATGLWWQRGAARPRLEPRGAASPRLLRSLGEHGEESGRQCWFLDLTTDLAIPVIAAVSTEDDGTLPAIGVACRHRLLDAMEGAFLEMLQSELAIAALLQRLDEAEPSAADAAIALWYEEVDTKHAPWLAPDGVAERLPSDAVGTVLERLTACGLDAYAMDLTRPSLGIPVVKAIVPGLAHFRRPQGRRRLMRVPEQLGWSSLLAEDGGFNIVPLLI
jgi:thiazole/oxazole-forming peptide maturase SagD family component